MYDYHRSYEIDRTHMKMLVTLNLNGYKLTNASLDSNDNSSSAATIKMVKDLETKVYPHITNYTYREIFEEFYDLINDTGALKLLKGSSGVIINGINPNSTFPGGTIADFIHEAITFRTR